jgi:hypothetical protein
MKERLQRIILKGIALGGYLLCRLYPEIGKLKLHVCVWPAPALPNQKKVDVYFFDLRGDYFKGFKKQ